jgi:hypothetical protein
MCALSGVSGILSSFLLDRSSLMAQTFNGIGLTSHIVLKGLTGVPDDCRTVMFVKEGKTAVAKVFFHYFGFREPNNETRVMEDMLVRNGSPSIIIREDQSAHRQHELVVAVSDPQWVIREFLEWVQYYSLVYGIQLGANESAAISLPEVFGEGVWIRLVKITK